jgi:hypothetical protein
MRIVCQLSILARLFCRRFSHPSRVSNVARIALPIAMGLLISACHCFHSRHFEVVCIKRKWQLGTDATRGGWSNHIQSLIALAHDREPQQTRRPARSVEWSAAFRRPKQNRARFAAKGLPPSHQHKDVRVGRSSPVNDVPAGSNSPSKRNVS